MKVFDRGMLRVPQFPHNAKLEDVWFELLESIAYASPDFYKLVSDLMPEDLEDQPSKIKSTIYKYFNRAKYRCTPLGTLSSFGIVNINLARATGVQIKSIRTFHRFADWKNIQHLEYEFKDVLAQNYKLFTNSTYYVIGNSIRYVRRKEDIKSFELAEVELREDVKQVLEFLHQPCPVSDLLIHFEKDYTREHLLTLIESMILANLLLTEADPNTSGREYFNRANREEYKKTNPYIISELNYNQKNLSPKYFKNFGSLIQLLTQILPSDTNSIHITEFIARYTKRFDRKHVLVMEALDPQIGVGYGDFHTDQKDTLVNKLLGNSRRDKKEDEAAILNKFIKSQIAFHAGDVIDLSELELGQDKRAKTNKLPNTFSVIGSIIDEQFHVERIGGHSANQLAGRFTICGDEALRYAKDIAQVEKDANPDIIFFDIIYHAELSVDNINRRTSLYEKEISLVSYPGMDEPLTLNDLYISISGNAIVLRSKRLGKRVIPRMASAYNYRRSQLPVFRFLYDLAFYNVWPELTFDLTSILPDLRFYPKVIYRNIVISMPRLIIQAEELKGKSEQEKEQYIASLLRECGMNACIKLMNGEEHMIFDLNNADQLRQFIAELTSRERSTVEEMILPKDALIRDEHGKPFINQLVIPMYHSNEIYPESAAEIQDTTTLERDFLPLMEWAYYDIYLHPLDANEILLHPIRHILDLYHQKIEKWFFIRYNEGGEHIRLRIKSDQQTLSDITRQLTNSIRPYYDAGRISNFKICTYQRELERYDVVGMSNVESHFHLGSQLAMQMILENYNDSDKYEHCVSIMRTIKDSQVIGDKRFKAWTDFIRTMLEKEHQLNQASYKILNNEIRLHYSYNPRKLTEPEQAFARSLIYLIKCCPDRRRAPLLADFMHMHINRLFEENQRAHEMIWYNIFRTAYMKEENAINKASHVVG